MDSSEPIVITVFRAKYGYDSKLKGYEMTTAPNYVRFHIEGDTIEKLLSNLMVLGHSFQVVVETQEATFAEFISLKPIPSGDRPSLGGSFCRKGNEI